MLRDEQEGWTYRGIEDDDLYKILETYIRVALALLDAVYFNMGRKSRLGTVEETNDCLTVSITVLLDFISML